MEDPTGATETGCLGGYEVLSVAELAGLGYDRDGWASMTDANLDGTI